MCSIAKFVFMFQGGHISQRGQINGTMSINCAMVGLASLNATLGCPDQFAMATAMTLTKNVFYSEKEKCQVRKCSIAKFDFMPSREISNCEYFS